MTLIFEDSIYSDKESQCDVVNCNTIKGVHLHALMDDKKKEKGEIKGPHWLCVKHYNQYKRELEMKK